MVSRINKLSTSFLFYFFFQIENCSQNFGEKKLFKKIIEKDPSVAIAMHPPLSVYEWPRMNCKIVSQHIEMKLKKQIHKSGTKKFFFKMKHQGKFLPYKNET